MHSVWSYQATGVFLTHALITHGFARAVRTLSLQLDNRVQRLEARGLGHTPQAPCNQVGSSFLNRAALAADHEYNCLAIPMEMIASEI